MHPFLVKTRELRFFWPYFVGTLLVMCYCIFSTQFTMRSLSNFKGSCCHSPSYTSLYYVLLLLHILTLYIIMDYCALVGSILKQFTRERGTDLYPMHSPAVLQSPKAWVQTWNEAKVRPACTVLISDLHSCLCCK